MGFSSLHTTPYSSRAGATGNAPRASERFGWARSGWNRFRAGIRSWLAGDRRLSARAGLADGGVLAELATRIGSTGPRRKTASAIRTAKTRERPAMETLSTT